MFTWWIVLSGGSVPSSVLHLTCSNVGPQPLRCPCAPALPPTCSTQYPLPFAAVLPASAPPHHQTVPSQFPCATWAIRSSAYPHTDLPRQHAGLARHANVSVSHKMRCLFYLCSGRYRSSTFCSAPPLSSPSHADAGAVHSLTTAPFGKLIALP